MFRLEPAFMPVELCRWNEDSNSNAYPIIGLKLNRIVAVQVSDTTMLNRDKMPVTKNKKFKIRNKKVEGRSQTINLLYAKK